MNQSRVKIGIGCSGMGRKGMDDTESIALIHEAMERGIPLLDTADFYNSGGSEMTLGKALHGIERSRYEVALKFGALMSPEGAIYGLDVHPDRIKNYLTHSLRRMKLDYVDVFMPSRIDLAIPVEETIGAISELVEGGYVKKIGLTQVDVETLNRAEKMHHISYLESNYSLFNREIEAELMPAARENQTEIIAFGVLAQGLLTGTFSSEANNYNTHISLFKSENIRGNLKLVERLRIIADEKGVSVANLAIAWVMAKGAAILPIIGMTKRSRLQAVMDASELSLTSTDIERIEAAIPQNQILGTAFPKMQFENGKIVAVD
ncbi:aldo/keto reductase [Listeria grayi]|uniref:Oxidoreductase, aldo/keto reductase family protein n=1 Tax=Listeria grayi DSM 20601 TaxID=525367 RepID=D7V0C1_LISGR|nr:aldo/keto reductase [Listeria grayi]EFI83014.1 oxidoreductase, aldo/keto reductase family protein [Listeria grayi DSM 20601]